MASRRHVSLDKVGAIASFVCAVHCLLTGVALGILSIVGLGFFASPWVDRTFISIAFLVGAAAAWHGYRKHGSTIPALMFVVGLAMVLWSRFGVAHDHGGTHSGGLAHTVGTVLSVIGGLLLVSFHIVNMRLQHKCRCSACVAKEDAAAPGPVESRVTAVR